MVKLIINADDCGISKHVDAEIHRFVEKGLISSTTIMANMDDFVGGVALYKNFSDVISFGIHFNLTEGTPLIQSQLLLDKGFLVENGDTVSFCGKEFDYQLLTKEMKCEIRKELECQLQKLLDSGVKVSHFDSHHHVHFHRQIIGVFCHVAMKYGINRMRRNSNVLESKLLTLKTKLWYALLKMNYSELQSTDYFCGLTELLFLAKKNALKSDRLYEGMCHPGHVGDNYKKENRAMEFYLPELLKGGGVKLMNYNDI